MASEIRVNKIENRSGLGTVTFADTGVDLAGIVTATTFSGSGASLTALPAAQVTGTLPAISGANLTALNGSNIASGTVADARISTLTASKLSGALPAISALNLTNVPAANVVGVHTSLNITGSTTVGGGVTISESGIEASGIGITCANINGTQIGGRRNLIINGAMLVAQRATSSTDQLYSTVDRIRAARSGVDEQPTFSQATLTSAPGPYREGHRKAFKVTNGNQTSGAGSNDTISFQYRLEAQDVANSGWNYTDTNSFITLQFWVKSSVAQNFYIRLFTQDGTAKNYPMETGTLTANTWKKVIKTIPGHADLQFDNDVNRGFNIDFSLFRGTDQTGSGATLNQWANIDDNARIPDMTSTWFTTNDATFFVTGLQLEVGSQATPFEHRSFGEELTLCQRYYVEMGGGNYGDYAYMTGYLFNNGNSLAFGLYLPCAMRATPTIAVTGNLKARESGNAVDANSPAIGGYDTNSNWIACSIGLTSDMGSNGDPVTLNNTNNAGITLDAEL